MKKISNGTTVILFKDSSYNNRDLDGENVIKGKIIDYKGLCGLEDYHLFGSDFKPSSCGKYEVLGEDGNTYITYYGLIPNNEFYIKTFQEHINYLMQLVNKCNEELNIVKENKVEYNNSIIHLLQEKDKNFEVKSSSILSLERKK